MKRKELTVTAEYSPDGPAAEVLTEALFLAFLRRMLTDAEA